MKKLLLLFLFCLPLCVSFAQRIKIDECNVTRYYASVTHHFMAFGSVYVETDPKEPVDICVKVVNSSPATFSIYKTTDKPQDCGEWRFVNDRSKAKFTIRYVKDHEDCTVRFVQNRSDAGCWGSVEH